MSSAQIAIEHIHNTHKHTYTERCECHLAKKQEAHIKRYVNHTVEIRRAYLEIQFSGFHWNIVDYFKIVLNWHSMCPSLIGSIHRSLYFAESRNHFYCFPIGNRKPTIVTLSIIIVSIYNFDKVLNETCEYCNFWRRHFPKKKKKIDLICVT